MHEVRHHSWHEMTGWSVCWFENPLGLDDDGVVEGVSLHDDRCGLEVLEEKDGDVVVHRREEVQRGIHAFNSG
jgi:hypothetical protein